MAKTTRRRNEKLLIAMGNRFRHIRKERKLSQVTAYIDTEIHISRVEQGKYNLTISTVSDLCEYYGITLKEFFDGLEIE